MILYSILLCVYVVFISIFKLNIVINDILSLYMYIIYIRLL